MEESNWATSIVNIVGRSDSQGIESYTHYRAQLIYQSTQVHQFYVNDPKADTPVVVTDTTEDNPDQPAVVVTPSNPMITDWPDVINCGSVITEPVLFWLRKVHNHAEYIWLGGDCQDGCRIEYNKNTDKTFK